MARALATLFGAASFLFTQVRFLVPDATRAAIWQAMAPTAAGGGPPGRYGGRRGPCWARPADAGAGRPRRGRGDGGQRRTRPGLCQRRAGASGGGARHAAGGVAGRFGGGPFTALLRKEALLLLRHPGLAAQLFYQFVFLVPGVIALMRRGRAGGIQTPAGVVFLTAMMTGRIARIIAVGPFEADQAEALAATAPVASRRVVSAKLLVTVACWPW